MKKKLLALFASMAIVLSLSALMVFADETKETGEYPVKTEESVTGESIPVEDTDDDFVAEKVTQKTIKVNTDVTDHLENQKDAFVYFFTLDAPGKVQIQ